jgi:hypothetical protein
MGIRARFGDVRKCFESISNGEDSLSGKMVIHFVIGPDGSVSDAGVPINTFGGETRSACVAAAVRKWHFPRSDGGVVVVDYPVVF